MNPHPELPVVDDGASPEQVRFPSRLGMAIAFLVFASTLAGTGTLGLFTDDDAALLRAQATAATLARVPELRPEWIAASPPPVPRGEVPAELLAAYTKTPQLMFLCPVNETLLRAMWRPGQGLTAVLGPEAPREFLVFATPDEGTFPRYRYLPSTTMPDGLVTNRFGFRGPDVAIDKPARTVRIAFVGASACVDGHLFPWSFPELVGNWLQLWALVNGRDVRFEVLDAGREAITSQDIRAIVAQEVLPLAVDYVVYYEGQNQFGVADLLRHVQVDGDFTPGQPPKDVRTDLRMADADPAGLLDRGAAASTTVRRLRRILGTHDGLPEPEKPAQRIVLPAGIDEDAPDAARAHELLQLGQILADLDAMHAACRTAGATLIVSSFDRLCAPGLRLDLKEGHSAFSQLNRDYWPLSYETIRRLSDLQNRCLQAWAAARGAPFLRTAEGLPQDPLLYTDMVHATELGSRLRAWAICAELLPIVARDLDRGAVPRPDTQVDADLPFLRPARRLTAEELDRR